MSLNCNNVQDFVTLYKDGVLSEETTAQINYHLSECKSCRDFYREYDGMNTAIANPEKIPEENVSYAVLAKKIRKKKTTDSLFLAAGMVAVTAAAVVLTHVLFPKKEQ